jgi:hypothetical protein
MGKARQKGVDELRAPSLASWGTQGPRTRLNATASRLIMPAQNTEGRRVSDARKMAERCRRLADNLLREDDWVRRILLNLAAEFDEVSAAQESVGAAKRATEGPVRPDVQGGQASVSSPFKLASDMSPRITRTRRMGQNPALLGDSYPIRLDTQSNLVARIFPIS